ncbi:MAG: lysophospholipase L1-like esterase [Rhodothermales bacterium]|jgi:lysophospholipase L1-like esterase
MKSILCYGDSNTWGFIPGTDYERHPYHRRWPGVMAGLLGDGFLVIEEGLSGRTTVYDDPTFLDRNGRVHLPSVLDTHTPVDLVIIMLGTNDTKHHLGLNADDIARGAAWLVNYVLASQAGPGKGAPHVLLAAPVAISDAAPLVCGHAFDGAPEKSRQFPRAYGELAEQLGVPLFDAATAASPDDADGLHLDEPAHQALAIALAERVRELLG